ncbi:TatD family hydrolase [Galactobacillus timonensis]|uniref:TatD family hydrolase n=1 Tax=Galactobacillus timonensis TaxID=2041840 RepID=UPI000C823E80|nr:TatD family hydrolase [Galactobacillus timonensis]
MLDGIVDTHAHMDDPCYKDHLSEILASEKAKGVFRIITSGSNLPSSRASISLAHTYDLLKASVGIYPNEAAGLPDDYIDQLRTMAQDPQAVAIGEIGLDYGYEQRPAPEIEKPVFHAQLQLAKEMNLPIVIHDRDADEDILQMLREFPGLKGTVHRFFSLPKYAEQFLDLGYYISVGPQITYPHSERLLETIRLLPMDRLLLETDAPFLPSYQVPFPAYPSMIEEAAVRIAEIRHCSPQDVVSQAKKNAETLFSSRLFD